MTRIILIILVLIAFSSPAISTGAKAKTGVNHDVEITVKRASVGNLLKAKWMEVEENLNEWWTDLWVSEKNQKTKWAS